MAKGRGQRISGLHWVPFFAGLGSACLYVYFMAARGGEIGLGLRFTMVIGIAIGLLAVVQSILAASSAHQLVRLRGHRDMLEEQLHSQIEVLTAMREVSRILSDAVDLKPIATQVLNILAPLLNSEEIALILRNENGSLTLKALRRDGKTTYADELSGGEVELDTAAQALELGTLVGAIQDSARVFCVPLLADEAAVGVMRFEIPLEGPHGEKERRIGDLESILFDIAKHLALVIKTPRLHDRAILDSLTGLFTRWHFDIRIEEMFRLARRYATPFSLVLMDIDHFKRVNDTHGHRAGDAALREIASVVTTSIRNCDSAFRYGGEEFAILLPETTADGAALLAERLRAKVKAHPLKTDGAVVRVTISLGVAEYGPNLSSHGELIGLADRALYKVKQDGRDAVAIAKGAAVDSGNS